MSKPLIRTLWRVRLVKHNDISDEPGGFQKWVARLPDELAILSKGNKVLADFAKEHDLQHYEDDEVIKISDEERLLLILKLDPRLKLERMS